MKNNRNKKIGANLRKLRGNKSRSEIARELGVSVSAVTMYELGERSPKDDVKKRYSKIFGKTVEALFFS